MSRHPLLVLLFFIVSSNSYTLNQFPAKNFDPVSVIDEKALDKIRSDKDYDYTEEHTKSTWWSDFKQWLYVQFQELIGEDLFNSTFIKVVLRLLPYVIIAIALFMLIWYIVKSNPGTQIMSRHTKSNVIYTQEEELLMKQNLVKLAEKAISNNNYKLAIRYLYLNCIKRLDRKRLVIFMNDKTNYDYVSEIKFSNLKNIFKKLTQKYELVWYGEIYFDDEYYDTFKKEYQKLHSELDTTKYA